MRATADDALDASAAAQRTASYEEAEHAAKEQARVEKQARASAERRSNEMALRALEAERTKRLEAEKLLALERSYSAQLLSKIDVRDRRKYRRTQAVIAIQAAWRGYWARQCLLAGKQELEKRKGWGILRKDDTMPKTLKEDATTDELCAQSPRIRLALTGILIHVACRV